MTGDDRNPGEKRSARDGSESSSHPAVEQDGAKYDRQSNSDPIQTSEPLTEVFEVAFDGGDEDPDCPRSMGVLRKWMIVCIVASGSFNV